MAKVVFLQARYARKYKDMIKPVSEGQINKEIQSGYKPLAIESGLAILPLGDLGDRDFELLCFSLIKQEIKKDEFNGHTDIALMQGVSERGRDCVLYKNGKVSGLIQCKKYQGRLTRPQVIKEILKFIIFSTLDKSILPSPEEFEYKLYASNDFTEPAINLIYSFRAEIEKDIENGNVSSYIDELVEEYESFSCYRGASPKKEIIKNLKAISVTSSNGTDITCRLYRNDSILNSFFNIKTVVSLEAADDLIRNALDDYGLKVLTDEDLKVIQGRIGGTGEENRVNLGYVDFFGYNKRFFSYLSGDPFKELMTAIAHIKTILHKELLDFVNSEMHKKIQEEITQKLLFRGEIHPFSVGLAPPYLFSRFSSKLVSKTMPKEMLPDLYPEYSMTQDDLISKISKTLFDSSERVMNADYSHLVGTPEDIEYKIRIYEHMHSGLSNIEDAKNVFKKDLEKLLPVLNGIEKELCNLFCEEQTVVIKDGSFFDNDAELKRMGETLKTIDNGITLIRPPAVKSKKVR